MQPIRVKDNQNLKVHTAKYLIREQMKGELSQAIIKAFVMAKALPHIRVLDGLYALISEKWYSLYRPYVRFEGSVRVSLELETEQKGVYVIDVLLKDIEHKILVAKFSGQPILKFPDAKEILDKLDAIRILLNDIEYYMEVSESRSDLKPDVWNNEYFDEMKREEGF